MGRYEVVPVRCAVGLRWALWDHLFRRHVEDEYHVARLYACAVQACAAMVELNRKG